MRNIIFDAGPIISLTMNNLLWILTELKQKYNGNFYNTEKIKKELVDVPLETKKFKFEALQVLHLINAGIIEVAGSYEIDRLANQLIEKANRTFKAYGHWINIVQYGEMSVLAAAINLNSDTIAVDERTTRLLLENPKKVSEILENTLHTNIFTDNNNLKDFLDLCGNLKPIRSVELVTVAFELGILDIFLAEIENPKETLLDSVLWGVKLSGCAVSKEEIEEILKIERVK